MNNISEYKDTSKALFKTNISMTYKESARVTNKVNKIWNLRVFFDFLDDNWFIQSREGGYTTLPPSLSRV